MPSRREDELISRSLDRFTPAVDWIVRHSRLVTAAGIALTAGMSLVAAQLRPDEKWEYAMPTDTSAYQALAWCDEAFGGIEFAHVTVRWSERQAESPAEILQVTREVRQLVEGEPLLKHPLSIGDLLATFPSDADDPETLMSFAALLPPPLRNLLYNPEERQAQVLMRCQDKGIRLYAPVFRRIDAGLTELAARHPGFTFDLDGGPVWRAENLYQVVVDLASSLGSAGIIILLVMAGVYRSVRIGLISVLPNVLPLSFPAKTRLRCIARFDNSDANLNNPDPNASVRWGDQTWEEMALGYFAVALPLQRSDADPPADEESSSQRLTEAQSKARRLLKDLDADGDGSAHRAEATEQFATFAFDRYDADADGELTLEELTDAVEQSLRRKDRRCER